MKYTFETLRDACAMILPAQAHIPPSQLAMPERLGMVARVWMIKHGPMDHGIGPLDFDVRRAFAICQQALIDLSETGIINYTDSEIPGT